MKYKTARLMVKYPDSYIMRFFKENDDNIGTGGKTPRTFTREEYIDIDIDLETGQILNWIPPTEEEIDEV